ncbi:MAG: MIP/aquaporin family protein [Spiroplasma sp.]|nr:MIP/aquaporin family protein [Spiroplasma sp.]
MPEVVQVIVGELVGTFLLVLLGNGVVANVALKRTLGNNSGWIVVSVGWGFAVGIAALLSSISGAHLNPAVTIGLLVANHTDAFVGGKIVYAPIYIAIQFVGAMLGQLFVFLAYFKEYQTTTEKDKVLSTFATKPVNRSYVWNVISELIATFVLMLIVGGTFIIKNLMNQPAISGFNNVTGPIILGLGVMVIGLGLGGSTGFAINPARDLGPRLIHQILPLKSKGPSDWQYSWVPVIGPILGAALAGGLIRLLGIF